MTNLVIFFLIFLAVGAGFLMVNLIVGKFLRPRRPSAEKETIYECGEPTIGTSWIQFDLRFYVVALLFVIFDVEMAFFFPWGTVFGNTTKLARDDITLEERKRLQDELLGERLWALNQAGLPPAPVAAEDSPANKPKAKGKGKGAKAAKPKEAEVKPPEPAKAAIETGPPPRLSAEAQVADQRESAKRLAWLAFTDILVFFGVLLVGFAYLWKRGDLDWVRSTAAQDQQSPPAASAGTEA